VIDKLKEKSAAHANCVGGFFICATFFAKGAGGMALGAYRFAWPD
jgi:hypothetical protein